MTEPKIHIHGGTTGKNSIWALTALRNATALLRMYTP